MQKQPTPEQEEKESLLISARSIAIIYQLGKKDMDNFIQLARKYDIMEIIQKLEQDEVRYLLYSLLNYTRNLELAIETKFQDNETWYTNLSDNTYLDLESARKATERLMQLLSS